MKNIFTLIFAALSVSAFSQNVGINPSGATPNASAGLDVDFTNMGVLMPRVSLTQTALASPITSPAASLVVYNTASVNDVTPGFYYWDGSKWLRLLNSNGNFCSGATANYISKFTNSSSICNSIIYDNGTNVGISTASPSMKLHVLTSGNFNEGILLESPLDQGADYTQRKMRAVHRICTAWEFMMHRVRKLFRSKMKQQVPTGW